MVGEEMKTVKALTTIGWIAVVFQVLAISGSLWEEYNGIHNLFPIMTHSAEAFWLSITWWVSYLSIGIIGVILLIIAKIRRKKIVSQEASEDAL